MAFKKTSLDFVKAISEYMAKGEGYDKCLRGVSPLLFIFNTFLHKIIVGFSVYKFKMFPINAKLKKF